jgi:RimJ/RimL family protein N-acetyltransferase
MAGTRPGQPRYPARRPLGPEPARRDHLELRIDQDHIASQHVAENAGFTRAGTVTQYVPGTGQTFEDLRYVLERQPEP